MTWLIERYAYDCIIVRILRVLADATVKDYSVYNVPLAYAHRLLVLYFVWLYLKWLCKYAPN